MSSQRGGIVRAHFRQGFAESSARRISGQFLLLLCLQPITHNSPNISGTATPASRPQRRGESGEGDRRKRRGEETMGKKQQRSNKEGDGGGEERCDDKKESDGESEEQKDEAPPNHSSPYQTSPQNVWISVDDFFSSSELSQPSPQVLQAKPVLRPLPLASHLPP